MPSSPLLGGLQKTAVTINFGTPPSGLSEHTASLPYAYVNDVVCVSPRTALGVNLGISHARIATNGVLTVGLLNFAGETAIGSIVFDVLYARSPGSA
jgi:hypothetical protein